MVDIKKHVTARVTGNEYVPTTTVEITEEQKVVDKRVIVVDPRTREDLAFSGIQSSPNNDQDDLNAEVLGERHAIAYNVDGTLLPEGLRAIQAIGRGTRVVDTEIEEQEAVDKYEPYPVKSIDGLTPEIAHATFAHVVAPEGFADGGEVKSDTVVYEEQYAKHVDTIVGKAALTLTQLQERVKEHLAKTTTHNYTTYRAGQAMLLTDEELSVLFHLAQYKLVEVREKNLDRFVDIEALHGLETKARNLLIERGIWE